MTKICEYGWNRKINDRSQKCGDVWFYVFKWGFNEDNDDVGGAQLYRTQEALCFSLPEMSAVLPESL